MGLGKVLLVEDSELVKEIMQRVLEDAGYEMAWLADPVGLAEVIRETKPDLVLMDVAMPSISGDEAVRRIRQVEDAADLPLLYHSGRSAEELRELVVRTGADGFIEKGCSDEEFLGEISRWVEVSRDRRGGSGPAGP